MRSRPFFASLPATFSETALTASATVAADLLDVMGFSTKKAWRGFCGPLSY
jgi:hypothetical protein